MIYLNNYLQTYLEKDIRAILTINDLNLYQKLLEVTAEQTGSVRDDKKTIDALHCSRDTLKKYRGYLSATLIYEELHPYIGSILKRLIKSPKGYLLNNGLTSYLTGINDLNILQKTGIIGYRFECWFLKELKIWLMHNPGRSKIYYYRTTAGVEIDFVVEQKPYVFPFKITFSNTIESKKVKALIQFMHEEPKAKLGFYIYMGPYKYDKELNICFLPAWAVC